LKIVNFAIQVGGQLLLPKSGLRTENGPKLWNSLPENIKQAETFGCFRNGMKKHLLDE
jgi:hypothetical protein